MSFYQYANGFQAMPKPGLARITDLLARVGNPQEKVPCIHVAGTNGKGSVCAFLDAILRAAGKKCGRYTSPNLRRVNERICVAGQEIGDAPLTVLLTELEGPAGQTEKALGEAPTPFEIWTAAAFLYFAREKCDVAVMEVGLGGLYDATNVISHPLCSIVTRLGMDHTAFLGNTLSEIAYNKAGIFKEGCPALTLPQEAEAMAVLRREAAAKHAPLTVTGTPFSRGHDGLSEVFDYAGMSGLRLSLPGEHQVENACLAVDCARLLGVGEDAIRHGLATARHPARLEVLEHDPIVLFDGGHNPNGIAALCRALDRYFPGQRFSVIFACMRDKDITPSLEMLQSHAARFFFTTVQHNPRAMTPEELQARAEDMGIAGAACPSLHAALAAAHCLPEGAGALPPILVCGSLYRYGNL